MTQPREAANVFYHLMEDLWGGADATPLNGVNPRNALEMFKLFFPEAPPLIAKENEHGNYFLACFPDNSTLVIYEDGSGLEQV